MISNRLFIILIIILTHFFSAASSTADTKEDMIEFSAYCKSVANSRAQFLNCLVEKAEGAEPEIDYAIANLYYKEGNIEKSIFYLKRSARKGYTEAKMELARFYFTEGPTRSCDKTIHWLNEAIQDGNDTARVRLANIYIFKKCDTGSSEEAFNLLLPAAKNGNANAQLTLGLMYKDGIGVNPDKEQAQYWLNMAEHNDNPKVREIARKALAQL